MLKWNLKATAMPWERHTPRVVGQTHTQGGGQMHGEENPFGGGQAHGGGQVLGGGEIPVGGPQQMALMFEMIKGMQQNQVELAESLKQLREANGNKEDHQNKNDNRNHEERESHNKNDTPFVTMSDVADLLKKGSAMEHISKFLDSMGPFAAHGDLCLREFSKSLVDRAYTCTKQQTGEDLVKYIHRFRDVSLDCHVKYQEGELVEVCIDNMLPEFRAHLENLDISRFAPLLQKARKTALSVKPQAEKSRDKKSLPQTLTVSTATAPSGTKRKNPTDKAYEEPPPLPFTAEEMMAIFDKWVQDQVIKLPKISKQPTAEEQKDPKYCRYHKIRESPHGGLPNPQMGGKGKAVVSVVIHGNVSDMEAEESAVVSSSLVPAAVRTLQKSPKFKSLFNQLGFGPEARNAATEALITIAAESGATCFTAEAHASRAFLETTNAITFTDEDMEVQYPDHRRPLYLPAVVKDVQVRRALVDTGSCLNLIPLSTLQAANVPQQKIQGSPMEVTGFGGVTEYTMGHVQLVLKVGPIVALTRFHVVNAETPYHVLLGRPWLHKHKLVSSTYHQCVKGRLNGKPIRIAANSCPFDQTEAHFVEAALYDDLASTGEPSIVRPCGTPLPAWEDIKDDPEIDLRELLQTKEEKEGMCVGPDCPQQEGPTPEEGGLQPSCHLIQQTENSGKVVVDQLQSTAISSEEVTVDHAQSMTESTAVDHKEVSGDQTESTVMSPGGSTVDHSRSTVMNSEEKDTVDQTEPTAMTKEKSTTAESNMTSKEELEVINLSNDPDISKPISISKSLSAKERKCLIDLLHEYKDVFAWDYHEMPGIDPGLVAHSLNVEPGTRPVVQPMRTFHTEVEAQITQEVKKLLAAGFIKPIQHPRWLSNIVPVKKKNGQIRCCVDFRNLNKACPKDEFPLPNMDLLIDSAAGHAMFSFMDGFSGYNQIRMSTKDAEKTAFRTPIGNFYYTVMPFGLKNAGATYQRTMTAMFHDMMHKEIEDYVDDIVVKSKKREGSSWNLKKAKASAIATMKAPTSHKELKSFLGRLSYIRRFIPGLAAVTAVFTPLMKKGVPFVWSTACQQAFEKIQVIMTKLPTWPKKDEDGTEKPIYYVSRALRDAETRYSGAERACLALIYASQRLRHYFLAHKIQLMTKSHPIRSLLHRPILSGRLAQWLLQLSQYEIITETPTAIKSQAIADLLAQFPGEDSSSISHEVPGEIGEALEDGETIAKSFKLDFSCSNNASEYEAYITGLAIAHEMGIKHLRVIGDSNLIICQTKGEFSLKEPSLALYRALAQKLEEKFDTFEISHAMRCENRYADALATLGSQVSFEGLKVDVTIDKRSMPITDLLREKFKEQNLDAEDWRTPIKAKLMSPEGVADLKVLKDYVLIAGDLYRRLPGGVLARCVNLQEAAKKLIEVHEKCCEFRDGVSLYRRLQCLGYFWPNMSKEAASLQEQCSFCQHQHESDQIYATFISSDWRTPFFEYLIENILPQTSQAAIRIKKLATRISNRDERSPFRRVWRTSRQEKIIPAAVDSWLLLANHEERHGRLRESLVTLAKLQANLIHTHPTSLQNMATPWPFHTWGLDLIGPINPSSGGYIWILVATEYFSKWVEAIPLRKATGAAVANFIREYIITRFGIPHKIISDNGTPFVNKNVREVLEHYRIKHRRSTPYYPQGNGQAEATNRMLLRILSKMVFDYGKGWSSHLADTLWAYRGSTKTATGFTPFSLVYGTDAISPTELLVPSPRILHGMDLEADADICAEARVADLESLEEARELAQVRSLRYHQKLADAYEKTLQTRIFAKGQMVLRTVDHVRRGLPSPSKFAPNWEGPYLIREAYDSGYYKLSTADGTTLVDPINGKWLKRYYS
uniref:RNA-directed DNA polymerase n=1 Tax=Fagus sylvatica TaxID=28930 RepID=A0A2N9IRS3_FAGSY